MTKYSTLLSLLLFSTFIFGQVEDVIINIGSASRLYQDGVNICCSYYDQIDVIDITDEANLSINIDVDGLTNPNGMVKYSEDFYVAAFGQGKIIKFNVNEPNYIDVRDVEDTPNTMIIIMTTYIIQIIMVTQFLCMI